MDTNRLTPKEIVAELNRYIIGQDDAKRMVAIALRNRWRRQQVPKPLQDEIFPKNIIMIGPTGIGKTEIARRLSKLAQAPFVKVEATKYTEVGYVGKDVESMIRDIVEIGVNMVKAEEAEKVKGKAKEITEERLLDLILPRPKVAKVKTIKAINENSENIAEEENNNGITQEDFNNTREKFRILLREGKLDDRNIDLETNERALPTIEIFSAQGLEEMGFNIKEAFGNMFPKKKRRKKIRIHEARELILQEESVKLIDMDKVVTEGIKRSEQSGIIFIDEIDKIAVREHGRGPDVSREGVQRDILPIVEGTQVTTKYGVVKTNHMLFIASGAFHISKPSDLIPELQGRFPIRVELKRLGKDDFVRILTEPENKLPLQYTAMMKTEGVNLSFTGGAISKIAEIAAEVNDKMENIGARRLHTIFEKLFDELSFEANTLKNREVVIDETYVENKLRNLVENEDLSRYIL